LFIYEEDRAGIPSNVYAEKRIWKISQVLATAIKSTPEALEEVIRGIEKCTETNSQKFELIYQIMNPLIPQLKANKLFSEYLTKAHDFLKI
jgi:hypothetical protein